MKNLIVTSIDLGVPEEWSNALPTNIQKIDKGIGSFLTIDTALVSLWVYLCDWSFTINGSEILSSDVQDEEVFEKILTPLSEEYLASIKISGENSIVLSFSQGYELSIFANFEEYDGEDDLLIAFFKKGEPLAYSPERGWYRGN
ncbi:hypothetical protein QSV34_10550 [Porticoccus sp. W117]|uniref:hypothetical protein n=1 Tax=Porticoccus sp. W117 TaxID=3054777 RepID=UPI0025995415|nr:hypothetical protein [Porticoccus sp. W117]MDM3871790.1 hypothetical protein [Porticoccus sp. W117]